MKRLKRNYWTTEEVIKIIEGHMVIEDEDLSEDIKRMAHWHNCGIAAAAEVFRGFQIPIEQSRAMAYNITTGLVVHVGPQLPE